MKIVKLENGNVEIQNNTGQYITGFTLAPTEIRPLDHNEGVEIRQANNSTFTIPVEEVTATKVFPDPEVSFPINADKYYLARLLLADFFFEVSSGGGGGITGADNGNELVGATVGWGGSLNRLTTIRGNNQVLAIGFDATITPDPAQAIALNATEIALFGDDLNVNLTNRMQVIADSIDLQANTVQLQGIVDVEVSAPVFRLGQSNNFQFGDGVTEGDWRIAVSGTSLVFQRLESSVWVTKQTISA